jgi:hypothetical protein
MQAKVVLDRRVAGDERRAVRIAEAARVRQREKDTGQATVDGAAERLFDPPFEWFQQ